MCEQMIVAQCSPTLAGIKTANLFPCKYTDKQDLWDEIRGFNRTLSHKGVRMIPIKVNKDFALLYLYRPARLEMDLGHDIAAELLRQLGYSEASAGKCIAELIRRFREKEVFPHEVGLFLGYPPEDVKGFIDNNAACSKCVGCWKVYGDEEQAQRIFEKYRKCTAVYCSQWVAGKSIERLTVAV